MGGPHHPVSEPGVIVVQWLAPVYYANAGVFRAEILKAVSQLESRPTALVIDADAITDIDYTGTRTVRALTTELQRAHIVVGFARAVGGTTQNLARSGLRDLIGSDHIFATVDDAVTALRPRPGTSTGTGTGADGGKNTKT